MTSERHHQGPLDTNIVILRKWINAEELHAEMAITAITLAELSAGPHEVRRNDGQNDDEHAERARRLDVLQHAENEFDPIPFA
jgi:predicted nucleic acid-binding protein